MICVISMLAAVLQVSTVGTLHKF